MPVLSDIRARELLDRVSMARSERVAKYNQLTRIESELGASAVFGEAPRAVAAGS
jgi:enolase